MADIDMLGVAMVNRIPSQELSSAVVNEEGCRLVSVLSEVMHEVSQPYSFLGSFSG